MNTDLIPTRDVNVGDATWRVFSFLYPTDNISRIVFARCDAVARKLEAGAFTIVRTSRPLAPDKREWWISGVDAGDGQLLAGVDWWPGEPHLPDLALAELLIERRMAKAIDAAARGVDIAETLHYGNRGARILHGGIIRPFIGRG